MSDSYLHTLLENLGFGLFVVSLFLMAIFGLVLFATSEPARGRKARSNRCQARPRR